MSPTCRTCSIYACSSGRYCSRTYREWMRTGNFSHNGSLIAASLSRVCSFCTAGSWFFPRSSLFAGFPHDGVGGQVSPNVIREIGCLRCRLNRFSRSTGLRSGGTESRTRLNTSIFSYCSCTNAFSLPYKGGAVAPDPMHNDGESFRDFRKN